MHLKRTSAAYPSGASACRKSGLRHFFEVSMAPLRLRHGQGAMQRNPCYARLFADLPHTPQGAFSCPFGTIHLVSSNPIIASGGQSRAPPVAGGARRKPSEQGSARKAPRADAARPLQTALRPPEPPGFFDKLKALLRKAFFTPDVRSIGGGAGRTGCPHGRPLPRWRAWLPHKSAGWPRCPGRGRPPFLPF